jgi:3-hydroxyacyl-CoA dehydrogenase / enoyl-CoA hydratase / 3-hydroxybutyryl-CoA epimerase
MPGPAVRLEVLEGGVAAIVLDAGAAPFIFDEARIAELAAIARELAAKTDLAGVVVRSTHPEIFCAGADVDAMVAVTDRTEIQRLVAAGQNAFEELARLKAPTIALIHGLCVGGGLELALACSARLATDRAKLGLPETKLGILPAWGGSTRLPRLIGLLPAIELITAGKIVNASRARKLGLVDDIVPFELLEQAARRIIAAPPGARPQRRPRDPLSVRALAAFGPGKKLLRAKARAAILAETKGNYPAPPAALDVILQQHGLPRAAGLDLERSAVTDLLGTPVARELLGLFQMTRDSARPPIYSASAAAAPVREVAVVGAGVMGAGIAEVCARAGMRVRVIDAQPASLARCRAAIEAELARLVQRRDLSEAEMRNRMVRTTFSTAIDGLAAMDLVIEAVPERLDVKDKVLRAVAAAVRPGALIATNTSSYSLEELAPSVAKPERFLGLHWFNPAPRMPLVEVVRGRLTGDEPLRRGIRFVRDAGKTAVVVKDSPGFLVNRVLAPYLREACVVASEGVPITVIDRELERFGMPMGPFVLMDTIGLDVLADVSEHLRSRTGREPLHPAVMRLAVGGDLGKKSGRGFYHWDGSRAPNRSVGFPEEPREGFMPLPREIVARLIGALTREAKAALDDGLVSGPEEIDIATIFGIGFPPFRGGVLRYAATSGGDDRTAGFSRPDAARAVADRVEPARAGGPKATP